MPTLPASPTPRFVSAPMVIDPVLSQQFDQGHEHTRSRYSRGRRQYTLVYLVTSDDLHILLDFFQRQTRGGALSFAWDHPYSHTLTNISNNVPNIATTSHEHGYFSNEQVKVSGTVTHDGTYSITWFTTTRFLLLGTSGGTPENNVGTVALHFPAMKLVAPESIPQPQFREGFGSLGDNRGLFDFTITIEEKFG